MRSAWLVMGLLTACSGGSDFDIVAVINATPSGYAIVPTHSGLIADHGVDYRHFEDLDIAPPDVRLFPSVATVSSRMGFLPVFSANGRKAMIRAEDGTVQVVSTADGTLVAQLFVPNDVAVRPIAVSDDGSQVALQTNEAGSVPTLKNFNIVAMTTVDLGEVGQSAIGVYAGTDLYVSPNDGSPLFRSSNGGPATPLVSDTPAGFTDANVIAAEPNGTRVYFAAGQGGLRHLYEIDGTTTTPTVVDTGDASPGGLDGLAVAPGGILALHTQSMMWITEKNAKHPKRATGFNGPAPQGLAVAPDGSGCVFGATSELGFSFLTYETRGDSDYRALKGGVYTMIAVN